MRIIFFEIFVEACFVRNMLAGKLEDALSTEGVLQGLFTNSALCTYESSISPCSATFKIKYASHAFAAGARERAG